MEFELDINGATYKVYWGDEYDCEDFYYSVTWFEDLKKYEN